MPHDAPLLPATFYLRDPVSVARDLLGQRLVTRSAEARTSGIIVEVEAYLGEPDKAAHTYGGRRTDRNRSMWEAGGRAYVYFIYGIHHCVNVVAGNAGDPVAVLIRALEPDEGTEIMFGRRAAARGRRDLCSGPGKLCQALGIERRHDGIDLRGDELFIERRRTGALPGARIACGPRIGVAYAEEWAAQPLRFWIDDNEHVSRAHASRSATTGSRRAARRAGT